MSLEISLVVTGGVLREAAKRGVDEAVPEVVVVVRGEEEDLPAFKACLSGLSTVLDCTLSKGANSLDGFLTVTSFKSGVVLAAEASVSRRLWSSGCSCCSLPAVKGASIFVSLNF